MLAYEVLKQVCQFCDEDELGKKMGADFEGMGEDEKAKAEAMLNCLNLVQDEIATEYVPLIAEQKAFFDNFKFAISGLEHELAKVIKVKDKHGFSAKFKVYPSHIISPIKEGTIIYSFHPKTLELSSTLEVNVPARVIAYGTAREYFLKQGLDEDAQLFEMRFKDSLQILLSRPGSKIKVRSFL